MTDNRTNEPTPEQVEAAAKAIREVDGRSALIADVDLPEYRARAALVAAQGTAPREVRADHYIEVVVEDSEVHARLRCEATETASCRMRPDDWESMESWTEEECSTSGHPCWATKFIEDGGDEQLYGTDQVLGRVPVTVEYADGVEVSATSFAAPVLPSSTCQHNMVSYTDSVAEKREHFCSLCGYEPSSTVDEDALAEVLREAEQSWHLSDEKSQQSYACGAPDLKSKCIARAVAEWLKGQG